MRDVKGFEEIYSITARGRVYSKPRMVWRGTDKPFKVKGRWLKVRKPDKRGYMKFRSSVYGDYYDFAIHRMVAEAYIPNPKKLPQINHKDGNKQNNYYKNLEWCDGKYNMAHGVANDLFKYGEDNPNAKLTVNQIKQIRKMRKLGFSYRKIAEAVDISLTVVWNVVQGKAWRRVK